VDGSGNIWGPNNGTSIAEVSNSGTTLSPSTGFQAGYAAPSGQTDSQAQFTLPRAIAIDGSGNVWVTNSATGNTTVTVLVGAASPVVTPLVTAMKSGKLGQMP
jgi:hypothetical protein